MEGRAEEIYFSDPDQLVPPIVTRIWLPPSVSTFFLRQQPFDFYRGPGTTARVYGEWVVIFLASWFRTDSFLFCVHFRRLFISATFTSGSLSISLCMKNPC